MIRCKKNTIFILLTAAIIIAAVIVSSIVIVNIEFSKISIKCNVEKKDNGDVVLKTTLKDLNAKNITYGDAVDCKFSSGCVTQFTPILNGEFMHPGCDLIIANSNDDSIVFKIINHADTWALENLNDQSSVTISLREKAKYINLFNAFNMPINENANDIRSLRGGNLKFLDTFRCTNPYNNDETKTMFDFYTYNLNIETKINLDKNNKNIKSIDVKNKDCNKIVIDNLKFICENPARTCFYSSSIDMCGYFCALIEAIAGASYDEIVKDYMKTYEVLYNINENNHPDEYNAIKKYHIDIMLHKLSRTPFDSDISNIDFAYNAEFYLRINDVDESTIELIKSRLTN